MRVCSICGERNEDWMEICQRCGNSIANANQVEYKAKSKPQRFIDNSINNQNTYEKKPMVNMDLKITLVILLLILIGLIAYAVYSIV